MLENIFLLWNYSLWSIFLRWPRELNALQLQKTHANRKSTSKSQKHLNQFDSRCCKILTTQTNKDLICSAFLYLVALWVFSALVLSNCEVVFLICMCVLKLQCIELSRPTYILLLFTCISQCVAGPHGLSWQCFFVLTYFPLLLEV